MFHSRKYVFDAYFQLYAMVSCEIKKTVFKIKYAI